MPEQYLTLLQKLLEKKINLFVLDSNKAFRELFAKTFSSPAFNVHAAADLDEAREKTQAEPDWHCWFLDISSQDAANLDLLKGHPDFRFALVATSQPSMANARQALDAGAFEIIDKSLLASEISVETMTLVCQVAALGHVFGGCCQKCVSLCKIMIKHQCRTAEDLGIKAKYTQRSLEIFCLKNFGLTPFQIVNLYHTLFYLLAVPSLSLDQEYRDFCSTSLQYFVRNYHRLPSRLT